MSAESLVAKSTLQNSGSFSRAACVGFTNTHPYRGVGGLFCLAVPFSVQAECLIGYLVR